MEGVVNCPRLEELLASAEKAMERRDYKTAHDYVKEAMRVWTEEPRVCFMSGKIYDAENEHEKLLEEYRQAMLPAPYREENYYRYGQACTYLDMKDEALYVLERMQYLFSDNVWTGKMEAAYTFKN